MNALLVSPPPPFQPRQCSAYHKPLRSDYAVNKYYVAYINIEASRYTETCPEVPLTSM